jgi:hypothetical protein
MKQQHTSTATSILTTKSTYRSLSEQRLFDRTVLYVCLLTCVKECGIILKNVVLLSVIPRNIRIEVASFLGCFAISAGKYFPTFRESVRKCYPSISYSLPEELSVHSHSCQNKKTAKD